MYIYILRLQRGLWKIGKAFQLFRSKCHGTRCTELDVAFMCTSMLFHIQAVPSSNPYLEIGYPEWSFFVLFLIPFSYVPNSATKFTTRSSFQMSSNSSFANRTDTVVAYTTHSTRLNSTTQTTIRKILLDKAWKHQTVWIGDLNSDKTKRHYRISTKFSKSSDWLLNVMQQKKCFKNRGCNMSYAK